MEQDTRDLGDEDPIGHPDGPPEMVAKITDPDPYPASTVDWSAYGRPGVLMSLPVPKYRGYGIAHLIDYLTTPTGRQVRAIVGAFSVYADDALGFKRIRTPNNANFLLVIEGATERITIFGCQLRGFSEIAADPGDGDIYVVR